MPMLAWGQPPKNPMKVLGIEMGVDSIQFSSQLIDKGFTTKVTQYSNDEGSFDRTVFVGNFWQFEGCDINITPDSCGIINKVSITAKDPGGYKSQRLCESLSQKYESTPTITEKDSSLSYYQCFWTATNGIVHLYYLGGIGTPIAVLTYYNTDPQNYIDGIVKSKRSELQDL